MLLQFLRSVTFFDFLHRIDQDLAEQARGQRCPCCGGPLHLASYQRKPRGGPANLPEHYFVRLSLCCGSSGCRRRVLPPSSLFFGRRVYWSAVILVVTTLRQQRTMGFSARKCKELFGITHPTLLRWMSWFRNLFPRSDLWLRLRGRVSPMISDKELPGSLLKHFIRVYGSAQRGLIGCLTFLAVDRPGPLVQA